MTQGNPKAAKEATSEEHTDAGEEPTERRDTILTKPRRRSQKKPRESDAPEEVETTVESKRAALRKPAHKGPPEDGTPSTTTIYVANIPFEYTDEKVRYIRSFGANG